MRLRAVVALACVARLAAAESRTIHGVVTSGHHPIAGATVLAEHGEIAVTDTDGYFTITTGERTLTISAPGYVSRSVAVDAAARVELVALSGGEVIEVTGKAPEQTKALSYKLTSDEIRDLPGAANDVLRAAQVLPGVARIPYAFGGLVLRGMSPRDSAVYLDGIEVPLAFHFGGITSFYPSAMLSDLTLSPGGYDVSYGRAQGGIVTLSTREPRTDHWRAGGSIGLLDSGAWAEGPVAGGGILVGVRRSYFDTVVRPFVDADVPLPSYWDAQIRTSFGDPARGGRFTPMLFLSIDRVSNDGNGQDVESVGLTAMFVRIAAPYLRTWGPLTLRVVPWLGTDRLSFDDAKDGRAETFVRPVYPGGLRADLTRDFCWGDVRGGLDADGGYLSHSQVGFSGLDVGPQQVNGTSTLAWTDLALWSEARFKIDGDRFAIKPGVRVEGYGLAREWVVDPRINISQRLTDTWTLRQAVGRFHQPPTPADVDPAGGNPALRSSYVDQASLGVDGAIRDIAASFTGFFEYGQHIGVPVPHGPTDNFQPNLGGLGPTFDLLLEKYLGFPTYREDVGRARSYGLEVMLKRSTRRTFWMIAYTLSQSQRTDAPTVSVGWRPFELDQRHNLNVAGSIALTHWRLGARIQIVSGNPYSPTVCNGDCFQQPWAGTLPTFFSLDLRADRRWHTRWGDINLYFDIQNATNYHNVEGREPDGDHDRDIAGTPLLPFIGVELIPY